VGLKTKHQKGDVHISASEQRQKYTLLYSPAIQPTKTNLISQWMWNNSHGAAVASPFLALASPCWQGSTQRQCGAPHCLSSTTTFSTRKTQFFSCLTASTSTTKCWGLFKQVTALTWQNSSSLHCYWLPSISASLLLCFLQSLDLLSCPHWSAASVNVHFSETPVLTCSAGKPTLLLQPG